MLVLCSYALLPRSTSISYELYYHVLISLVLSYEYITLAWDTLSNSFLQFLLLFAYVNQACTKTSTLNLHTRGIVINHQKEGD
jgi:hypothetical protein